MKNYIIDTKTLWIEEEKDYIIAHESQKDIIVDERKMNNFLNQSCLYYGSSLMGRKMGTKALINEQYKLPIILNDKYPLVIFPIVCGKNHKNTWIVYNNVSKYIQNSKSKVIVEFNDGTNYVFPTSYYQFHNQILKSSRLIVVFNARIK